MVIAHLLFAGGADGRGLQRGLERHGLLEQLVVEDADGVGQRLLDVAGQLGRSLVLAQHRLAELALILGGGVEDLVLDHIDHGGRFDVDDLAVLLHVDLVAGEHFLLRVNAVLHHQFDVLGQNIGRQGVGGAAQIRKTAARSLLDPRLLIAVAVKDDAAMLDERLAHKVVQRLVEVRRFLEHRVEPAELLRHDGVEHRDRAGDGLAGAGHTELELVAGEGHGRGTVAVGGVLRDGGQHVHADAQRLALGLGIVALTDDGVDDALQLGAEEDGDDGRRRFLRAETVIVAREGDGAAQQLLILVHALDEGGEEEQEHGVLAGRFAGGEQILARVGRERPVDVLTGAVDAGKGLFMQQADETVALGDLLHRLHDELVLIVGGVGVAVDGSHLVLTGGDLVVLGLGEHAELPQLLVQLLHKGRHARADDAEVVVVQLLALGRLAAEEGAAAQPQILTLEVQLAVNEEILLLGADLRRDLTDVLLAVEKMQQLHRFAANRLVRAQQRGLLVQRRAAVGAEHRRDAEAAVLDEGKGGGVPCAVAARLKGRAQAAGGEARSVGLAAHQFLAGEVHDDLAAADGIDKAVVLFGGDAGQGLKPMGKMRRAMLQRPGLHGLGDIVRGGQWQRLAAFQTVAPDFHRLMRNILLHRSLIKGHRTKQLGNTIFFTHRYEPPYSFFIYKKYG